MKPPINAMDSRSRSGGLWMSGLTVIGGKTKRLKVIFCKIDQQQIKRDANG